jgi:hypothetical protein
MCRVASENIKWVASKRYRQIYGEKLDVNVSGTVDVKAALNRGNARLLQVLDANPLPVIDVVTDGASVKIENQAAGSPSDDDKVLVNQDDSWV